MSIEARLFLIGALFVLMFLSGYLLLRAGRPYGAGLVTVHKLLSLANLALIALALQQLHQPDQVSGGEIATIVAAGALFLAAVLTGGWLSANKPPNKPVQLVHRIAPFLVVLLTALVLYLPPGKP